MKLDIEDGTSLLVRVDWWVVGGYVKNRQNSTQLKLELSLANNFIRGHNWETGVWYKEYQAIRN